MDANVRRFDGFATLYNTYRPTPPPIIIDILTQLAERETPALVVDIGCGTGTSTRLWQDHATKIIGIEPNDDMRAEAVKQTSTPIIEFRQGFGHETGLPDSCADIVTCSQSFHWMNPTPTLNEIARILKTGGIFAAYDARWPPVIQWEVEKVFYNMMKATVALERERNLSPNLQYYDKSQHQANMQASGHFRYTKQVWVHKRDSGNADKLIGAALSRGNIQTFMKKGVPESDYGLDKLREVANRVMGDKEMPWVWSYIVQVAVK